MTINNQKKLRVLILLLLGSFIAARLCFFLFPNIFEIWNSQALDQLFVLRSASEKLRPSYDSTVVHVDLNNSSIQKLKKFYLNRSHYARLIRNLSSMGVSSQVFDFIFAARADQKGDDALIQATEEAGNVYFGLVFELWHRDQPRRKQPGQPSEIRYLDQTKWNVTLEGKPRKLYLGENPMITFLDLASVSRGLGSLSVKFDRDGGLRKVPLLIRYGEAYYPLLPFRVVCDYLGVPPERILFKPGKHIILKDAKKPGHKTPYDIVIPIDHNNNLLINYIGPWERMDHYSFADILLASDDPGKMELWKKELEGKIVVVSDVSTGSTDIGPVPTDPNFPHSGVHSNIIHSILTKSFLKELPEFVMLITEILLMVSLFFLSLRFSALYFSFGSVLIAAFYLTIISIGFLYWNLIFHIIRPMLMVALAAISIIIYRYINEEKEKMESLRQSDFIRGTFGRYLSNEVVEELLESPEGLKMSGEVREVTFLVSDLRGFTSLTSRLSPQEVIGVINRYFKHMVEVISRYRGTVNAFMGDGILSFFGAPLHAEDDPERAVACAIEMQNTMEKVNAEQNRLNLPELAMGIGINTGEVVVGNIGSEKRVAYSAVGTAINIAYRIESNTIGGQILISPHTYEKVQSLVQAKNTKEVRFKGITHSVVLYDVTGMRGKYNIFLPEKKMDTFTKLDSPLPIECFSLEGKTLSEKAISGHIIHLGTKAAKVTLKRSVKAYENVRVQLGGQDTSNTSEAYGRVLPLEDSGSASAREMVLLQFTWLSERAKQLLKEARPASKPDT